MCVSTRERNQFPSVLLHDSDISPRLLNLTYGNLVRADNRVVP